MHIPRKIYVVKSRESIKGFHAQDSSYIVGFKSRRHARRVLDYTIGQVNLTQKAVYMGLLSLRKTSMKVHQTIYEMDSNEFMLLPNNKNVGIVLAYDLLYPMTFSSLIIDPVNDIESYRKNLNM